MTHPLKVMTVFGTRPDTVKMAPVVHALAAARPSIQPLVCVTAQHREMLDDLLELFEIVPDDDLDIMTAVAVKVGEDLAASRLQRDLAVNCATA